MIYIKTKMFDDRDGSGFCGIGFAVGATFGRPRRTA
jgi:hypothetical protein